MAWAVDLGVQITDVGRSLYEILIRYLSIIHLENNHRKINTLEEIEILKTASSSKYLFNDVTAGQNDPIYKRLPTSVI